MNTNGKVAKVDPPSFCPATTDSQRRATGSLLLALCQEDGVDYLNRAAAMIRTLPPVLRVRLDPELSRIELLYVLPAPGLLRQIHEALLLARSLENEPANRMTAEVV